MLPAVNNRMMAAINRQSRLADAVTQTEVQISTGKRLLRASEDPLAAARVTAISKAQSNNAVWKSNIENALAMNEDASSTIQMLSEYLTQAHESVINAGSGSLSATDREVLAAKLEGIAKSIDRLETRTGSNGQPLFSVGAPVTVRVDANAIFVPVPSRVDVFAKDGVSFAQSVRTAASSIRSGTSAETATSMDDLAAATDTVSNSLGQIGLIGSDLSTMLDTISIQDINLAAERSSLEDTDLSVAIAQLNAQQLTLEAAQAVFARMNRSSLFEMLG